MNIFQLDLDPECAAVYHPDKHVVKMIVEYSQLLSTAHRVLDGTLVEGKSKSGRKQKRFELSDSRDSVLYSATHINHPSAQWVRESDRNYRWLHNLLVALSREYTYRYGKIHKCAWTGLIDELRATPVFTPRVSETPLKLAMPDEYKDPNPVVAYRNYVKLAKTHLHSWKKRSVPFWIEN